MTTPVFSVSMANYNNATYIAEAVRSVLGQTFQDWELNVVDDCSTDGSVEVAHTFNDPRIRVFALDRNAGCGAAQRRAAECARGRYIAVLDSDDMLVPEALQIVCDAYEAHPAVGVVYSQYEVRDECMRSPQLGRSAHIPVGNSWLDVHHMNSGMVGHLRTFKKSAYLLTSGFWKHRSCVDKDLILKLEEVTSLLFVDRVLYWQRLHGSNMSKRGREEQAENGHIAVRNAHRRRGTVQVHPTYEE